MSSAARTSVPKSVYSRTALCAAALTLGRRARVSLASKGRHWHVEIAAAGRGAASELLAEALNEAFSFARRQARLKRVKPLAAAVVARLLSGGFPPMPADPLEQLEPQVRLDREAETLDLLERARRLA